MREPVKDQTLNSTQTLTLDLSKVKTPIEMKIDQVTDYWALTFTLLISVLVSSITAFVTIHLVTKSNKELLNSQTKQNSELLNNQNKLQDGIIANQVDQQRKEVRSKNRQEWINSVRSLIADHLAESEQFMITIDLEQNLRILNYKKAIIDNRNELSKILDYTDPSEEDILKYGKIPLPPPFPKTTEIIKKCGNITIYLDLLLSSKNELDREIHQLLTEIDKQIHLIYGLYMSKNKGESLSINELSKFPPCNSFYSLRKELSSKTKTLLKSEWERVKNLE